MVSPKRGRGQIQPLDFANFLGQSARAVAGMRETKIRFGVRAWEIIQEEADLDGVSASQFVREAALARAIYMRYKRGEVEPGQKFDELVAQLRGE